MRRARSFLAVVLLMLGSTASLCAYVTSAAPVVSERIAILDNSAQFTYPTENPWLNPESRNGLLCHNDPINRTDPFGLEFRGEDVPFQFVPSVPGEYGHTAFDVKAVVGYFPTEGGFSLRTTRLDVTILSRQVATEVKVAGEQRARPRTDEAIAATVKHEGLHGTDAKTFHDANQNRSFPGVFKSPSEAKNAASEAGKQLQREFKDSQKHTPPEKWTTS